MAEISSRAKDMATARQAAGEAPEIREGRIAELRKKIQEKSYEVKPEAIAEKMIKEHAEF